MVDIGYILEVDKIQYIVNALIRIKNTINKDYTLS